MPPPLVDLRTAVMLLTRLPVGRGGPEAPDLTRAVWAYPVVGALVGALGGLALAGLTALGLPAAAAAILAVAVQALATGGFHEDGLADCFDGFGGGWTRARKLEIMKDSRLGSYGALALILTLALRVQALALLAAAGAWPAFAAVLAAGALSRGSIVALLCALPAARPDGMGSVAGRPGGGVAAAGLILALAPLALTGDAAAAGLALGAAVAIGGGFAWLARRQIGGYTGDVLGAGQQLTETTALLALAVALAG
jgi:adenosylcobinamide-GDP ribazoletransferase